MLGILLRFQSVFGYSPHFSESVTVALHLTLATLVVLALFCADIFDLAARDLSAIARLPIVTMAFIDAHGVI